MFVRRTEGVSWRAAPGVRRWSSVTVGGHFGLGHLLWWGFWWFLILGPLWIVLECNALFITAVACMIAAAIYRISPGEIHIIKAGWFWLFDIDLPGGR